MEMPADDGSDSSRTCRATHGSDLDRIVAFGLDGRSAAGLE
jgi:hypothetical protein